MANNGIYYSSGNSLNFTTNNTTWSTLTSGGTFQMSAVSATTYYNLPPATFTGGTVSGNTTFTSGLTVNYIDFDTTPNVPSPTGGTLYFDSTENALSYKPITLLNDVTVNLGQESLIKIYNDLGYQINNGQALHITGSTSGSPTVSLAIGTGGDAVQFQVSGIATHDIPNSSFGFMTVFGTVRDINLTGFTVGEQIYLSQTVPGGFASYSNLFYTGRTCEIGHIIDNTSLGKLQVSILNEIEGTIITAQENNILGANNSSTGVFEFSGLSITTPSGTTFNVGAVNGWIVDNVTSPTNPTIQLIIYSGSSSIPSLYYSSATETYILLTSGLTITQQTTFPTPQQRRQNLYLGKFGHGNRQFLINTFNEPDSVLSPLSQLRDMFTPIKLVNDGVIASANGVNLNINTSSGVLYGLGIGYVTNKLNPNSLSVSGQSPATLQYRTQTGGTSTNTTLIQPGFYDAGGVITAISGIKATNQRIFLLQNGQIRIQYGQTEYNQLAAAVSALQNESFITFPNFKDNGILIGILSILSSCSDLTDTSKAQFFLVSKFGELIGAAGGTSTTTLQQAYNNSSDPEILINSALDGLSIRNGTGGADNVTSLIQGQNSGGTTTSFIRADGLISGSSVSTPSFTANSNGITATTVSATTYYNYPGSSSANCVTTFFVTNISGCSPVNMLSPLNVQDGLSVTGTSTFTSQANFIGGLSANTFSANTYQNLPSFNSVQINGTTQFLGDTNNFINFSGINITITSAATNTLVFSAGTGGGGGISGGGTTNYIPKFTGLTGIGNSQLQDDGSQVFTNQGYGSTLTGNLSINASGTTGIAGRATQYGVYGIISGTTAGASAIYGEAGKSQYGVYGLNQGDEAGEYIGVYGRSQQSDSGTAGTVYIGGKFYGDNGTGGGYSVQLQDGTEGVAKVLVSQTSDGKANWNTFSGINITITSAATNTLVFSAATGGGGGGVTSVTAGSGLSGDTTTGAITLITNISASSISDSTTVGQNLITIPNPSEIRYLRINADNSITTLTLATLKSELGMGSAVVSTDQTTTTGSTYQNVTELTFAMTAGKRYKWRATIWVTTTTTANFSTNGSAGTTIYRFTMGSGQSTNLVNNGIANNTGTVVGVGNNRIVSADGIYVATATGTFNIAMISQSTGGVVVKAGSIIEYEEVL